MIWQSTALMTAIDLVLLVAAAYATFIWLRYRGPLATLGITSSAVLMLAGILVIAGLYAADLASMHVLPALVGHASAMQIMRDLHLNWSWFAILGGVGLLVFGLVLLMRDLLPRTASAVERMQRITRELQSSQLELENRFLAIADAVPVAIHIARRSDGRTLFANHQWRDAIGGKHEDDDSIAKLFSDPTHRREIAEVLDREGTLTPTEVSMLRADGSEFWAVLSSRRIEFDGEHAILSALLDMSEQRQTQRRLRDSEKRFRAIAEATPYPLFIARKRDGRLLYANVAVRETMGFEDDLLEHQSIEMYWDPEDREPLIEALDREGRRSGTEVRHRTARGEMFWALTSSVALEFEGEEAILTSFVDISDRKRVEAELAAYRDHLEELIESRVALDALERARRARRIRRDARA